MRMALSQEITAPCSKEGAPERDVGSRLTARRVKGIDAASSFLNLSSLGASPMGSRLRCPRCAVALDAIGAQRAVRCSSCDTVWRTAPIHLTRSIRLETIRTASWLWIGHGVRVEARAVEIGGGITLQGTLLADNAVAGAVRIPPGGTFIGLLRTGNRACWSL